MGHAGPAPPGMSAASGAPARWRQRDVPGRRNGEPQGRQGGCAQPGPAAAPRRSGRGPAATWDNGMRLRPYRPRRDAEPALCGIGGRSHHRLEAAAGLPPSGRDRRADAAAAGWAVMRVLNVLACGVILGYRYLLSPLWPGVCRFEPTCSAYGLEAIRRHGVLRGGWLTLRRLSRCHPWGGAGLDLVPDAPRLSARCGRPDTHHPLRRP